LGWKDFSEKPANKLGQIEGFGTCQINNIGGLSRFVSFHSEDTHNAVWDSSNLMSFSWKLCARDSLKTTVEAPFTRDHLCRGLEPMWQSRFLHLFAHSDPVDQLHYAQFYQLVIDVRL
jgi:hypothetical protein